METKPPVSDPNALPYAPEMEAAVLGILLLESESADNWRKVSRLTPAMFGDQRNKYIFNTIRKLAAQGSSYHLLLVVNAMRDDGLDDGDMRYYMTGLTTGVAQHANIEPLALIVEQKWMAREMILDFEARARDLRKHSDPLEQLEKAKRKLVDITPRSGLKLVNAYDRWPDVVKTLQANVDRFRSGITLAGVSSGFHVVDNITLGWMPGEYYLFGARPAMGKTAWSLALAVAAARAGHPVHFTSLEMGADTLIQRIVAYQTEVSTWSMRKGDLTVDDFRRLNEAAERTLRNINIEDGNVRDIDGIYNSCYAFTLQKRQETDKHPVFFLDYAQLTDVESHSARMVQNREQVLSGVSRGWKAICKDMKGPGIALSQLSRAVESRADKKPQMSDLRESGSLEQDADLIGFLYRPEYYGIEFDETGKSLKGTGQVLIQKYREGAVGDCLLGFSGSRGWYNYNEDDIRFPEIRNKPIDFSAPKKDQIQDDTESNSGGGGDFFPF